MPNSVSPKFEPAHHECLTGPPALVKQTPQAVYPACLLAHSELAHQLSILTMSDGSSTQSPDTSPILSHSFPDANTSPDHGQCQRAHVLSLQPRGHRSTHRHLGRLRLAGDRSQTSTNSSLNDDSDRVLRAGGFELTGPASTTRQTQAPFMRTCADNLLAVTRLVAGPVEHPTGVSNTTVLDGVSDAPEPEPIAPAGLPAVQPKRHGQCCSR